MMVYSTDLAHQECMWDIDITSCCVISQRRSEWTSQLMWNGLHASLWIALGG